MKKLKKVASFAMALAMTFLMSVSAMAAEPVVSQDEAGQTVYTQTIDMSVEQSKKVTSSRALSLARDAGQSGETLPIDFRFTSLPANAEVRSVRVEPGRAVINNGNHIMMGSVILNTIKVVSPDANVTHLNSILFYRR